MLARVSNIESFRRWREEEDQAVEDLVHWITTDNPSAAMMAGTAFHAALEVCQPGEFDRLEANGYTFHLMGPRDAFAPEPVLALSAIRELRGFKVYGDLTVTGCVDVLDGLRIDDHKTTARFDAERYLAGYQWRFYLDIFGADVFRWNVFELRDVKPRAYEVQPPQTLEVYRYPGMHEDCARLAADYLEFARAHLPADYSLNFKDAA